MGEPVPPPPAAAPQTPPQPAVPAAPAPSLPQPQNPPPPPELASALPKPVPDPQLAALPDIPRPPPPVERPAPARKAAMRPIARPRPPGRPATLPGPAATKDEYLAYCQELIRRYYGMLPPALLAGRSGVTRLSIVILDDGTIARIAIERGSGYPDIDERLERMVAAVRRFPPLPQWFQGPSLPVLYNQVFRDGVLR
jgi:TonB family protein